MNLHLDTTAFQVLLNDIHDKTGYGWMCLKRIIMLFFC